MAGILLIGWPGTLIELMHDHEANIFSGPVSLPPADAFLSSDSRSENPDLENRKLAALVRILSSHPVVGAYMRMKVSDVQFSSKLKDAVAQSQMQATTFARFDAADARAEIEAARRAGTRVSFTDDRAVRAVGEAQLVSLFRRKQAELSSLKGVPVSAMSAEEHGAALRAVQLLAASKTMVKHGSNHGDGDFESLRAVEFARFLEILGCTGEYLPAVLKYVRAEAMANPGVASVSEPVRKAADVPVRRSAGIVRSTLSRIARALPFFRLSGR